MAPTRAVAGCTQHGMARPYWRRRAHRLRGTAGSFGLARVAALAGAIEDRLQREEDVADILAEFTTTLAASRLAVAKFNRNARAD